MSEFQARLINRVLRDALSYRPSNVDELRFGASVTRRLKDVLLGIAQQGAWVHATDDQVEHMVRVAESVFERIEDFEVLFERLGDSFSQARLVEILSYRILGSARTRMLRASRYREAVARANHNRAQRNVARVGEWALDLYTIPFERGESQICCHKMNMISTFDWEQYSYRGPRESIGASQGQVVIDGGAC